MELEILLLPEALWREMPGWFAAVRLELEILLLFEKNACTPPLSAEAFWMRDALTLQKTTTDALLTVCPVAPWMYTMGLAPVPVTLESVLSHWETSSA